MVDIFLPKCKPITIGSIYRPQKDGKFLEKLANIFTLLRSDCESYLMGDFNIDLNQPSSSLLNRYNNILNLYGFTQLIKDVTRFSLNTTSLLDHILVNFPDRTIQSGTLNMGISDHVVIYCTRKIKRYT